MSGTDRTDYAGLIALLNYLAAKDTDYYPVLAKKGCRRAADVIAALVEERDSYRKTANQMAERVAAAEMERDKLRAETEALWDALSWLDTIKRQHAPTTSGDDELVCVNGHDRCYLGPDPDCPYCERRPTTSRGDLLRRAQAAYKAMSPEQKAAHDEAQRQSWVRGMAPCEHGVLDWETCPDCRDKHRMDLPGEEG